MNKNILSNVFLFALVLSDVYYNGKKTISQKAEWAKQNIGGIMIWTISFDATGDDDSLLKAIGDIIRR